MPGLVTVIVQCVVINSKQYSPKNTPSIKIAL
jgi:hypothetical protein